MRLSVRPFALVIVAAAVLSGAGGAGAGAAATTCDGSAWWGCTSGEIDDGEAVLRGETGNGSGNSSGSRTGSSGDEVRESASDDGSCTSLVPLGTGACDWLQPRDDYDVVLVTMNDVARFRPAPTRQVMEPDGWAIVGLPVNVFAVAGQQLVAGELLGASADVRFTPVAFRWDYGDGDSTTSSTPGASWSSSGLREFARTATSHEYRSSGTYTIRSSVVYTVEYRIGQAAFVRIPGTLSVPATDLRVSAGSAKTVLVHRDCGRNPSGPGC